MPYLVVAVLLMVYNQVRFDNPFEFGQSYQLTYVDQSNYGDLMERLNLVNVLNGMIFSFAKSPEVSEVFPFVSHGGVLWENPVLVLGFAAGLDQKIKKKIRESKLRGFMVALVLTAVLIVIIQTVWSPWLLYRYSEDFLWLLSIFVFISVGFWIRTKERPIQTAGWICWLSILNVLIGCLIFLIPENRSLTEERPEILEWIFRALSCGILGI